MADGLPTVPDRPPGELAPRERPLPVPRVEQPQVVVPHVITPQVETPRVGTLEGGFALLGHVIDQAAEEGMGVASAMAKEAGLRSVTLDADGNIQVTKYPIVGRAAESFRRAMEASAITQGEAVVARDLVDLQQKFRDDPEGFRSAAQAYRQDKVAQYGEAAGPAVGLSLGHAIDMKAIETYRGMLNRQEGLSLRIAASSLETQLDQNADELAGLAIGGKLMETDKDGNRVFTPDAMARLQKQTALLGQVASNPRLGISKDAVDFKLKKLKDDLIAKDLSYQIEQIQKTEGPAAALSAAQNLRDNPGIDPLVRFNASQQAISAIRARQTTDNAIEKSVSSDIAQAMDDVTDGRLLVPERLAVLRREVDEANNPRLTEAMQTFEANLPTFANLRQLDRTGLQQFIAGTAEEMRKHGPSKQLIMAQTVAEQMLERQEKALKEDQVEYANRTGVVRLKPLDFNAPDWKEQIRKRISDGEAIGDHYGTKPAYFTKAERAQINGIFDQGGPAASELMNKLQEGGGTKAPRLFADLEDKGVPSAVSQATTTDLFRRMNLPDGDPNRISDLGPARDAFTQGRLKREDLDWLEKRFVESRGPMGERLSKQREEMVKAAGLDKSTLLSHDASGKMDSYKYERFIDQEVDNYRAAGKNPFDLFNPNSPNFLGRPEIINQFRTPLQEQIRNMQQRIAPVPPAGAAPAPALKRNPGESPDDYLKRTTAPQKQGSLLDTLFSALITPASAMESPLRTELPAAAGRIIREEERRRREEVLAQADIDTMERMGEVQKKRFQIPPAERPKGLAPNEDVYRPGLDEFPEDWETMHFSRDTGLITIKRSGIGLSPKQLRERGFR